MASIGTTLPSSTAASTTSTATAASSASGSNSLASQQTFLQLLVAQLQNQDPTQPVQGTEFVTQLATFSDVEQNLAVRQDVDAISNKVLGTVPSGGTVAATDTTGTTPTSGTTSTTGTSPTDTVSGG
jgi:flagellar basal-body rod modification protein FlgD